jgi:hypothetical protein
MRIRNLVFMLVGIALVGLAVVWVFYIQRGAHLELKGSILKVRTLAPDDSSSVAVIDFRFTNAADFPWMVRAVDVSAIDSAGARVEGYTISEADAARLFEYYPLLGQKFNDSLVARTRIQPHQTLDRMISARFEIPEAQLRSRKRLQIRVEDVDGAVSEIVEGPSR